MKVILREDVQKLGKSGDIVTVKEGFGRNFLLPRKMAVLANEKNVRQMQHDQGVISARRAKMKDQANAQSQQLSAIALSFKRKVGEQEKLYGSVTVIFNDAAPTEKGHRIDR